MRLRTSKKTIFVHPNGYFEVVEVSGVNLMGDPFCFHEAIYTPNRDRRGIAHEEKQEQAIRFKRMTSVEKEKIRALWRNGMKTMEISRATGRSTQAVRDATKDLREPKNVRVWTDAEKEQALGMWNCGANYSQIGRALDRNPASVRDMLRRELKMSGQ